MMNLAYDVVCALQGKMLATAESCTGGGIGHAITSVAGSSQVYKGGIVSYCNEIKHRVLGVREELLSRFGAVSALVAEAMAVGARTVLQTDIAVSVTGLAGPGADEYGNPVGTVFLGYADQNRVLSREFHISGSREHICNQAVESALALLLEINQEENV